MLQVVARTAAQRDELLALTPHGWHFDFLLTIQIQGSKRVRLQHFLRSALEDNVATFPSSLWTNIYNPVGCSHHILVVFHHNDRIAKITQFLQGIDEALIVTLMQADARLVEDVEHVNELTTNLCGQSDALTLTSRQT